MYQWRLLLEEYGPKTVCIHNTVADAIAWLEYDPSVNQTAERLRVTHDENQELKTQSETKLDGCLKTMVLTRSRHQQT